MLGILVFLSCLCGCCMGLERSGWPGYEYFPNLQGYLKVHDVPTDWRTARANCHRENALLASPWSPAFTSTITKLQSTKYPLYPTLYSGVGLREGSPGIPLEPTKNKRCPVFLTGGATDKVTCDQLLPYACFAHTPPTLSCEDNGYTYSIKTEKCYKLHKEEKMMDDAKSNCITEGGFLAKINDKTEKSVLQDMTSEGLTYIDNDDGGPEFRHLSSTGYTDYNCNSAHPFICERAKLKVESDLRD